MISEIERSIVFYVRYICMSKKTKYSVLHVSYKEHSILCLIIYNLEYILIPVQVGMELVVCAVHPIPGKFFFLWTTKLSNHGGKIGSQVS